MMLAWDRKNFRRRDSLSKKMIQHSSHVVHTFRLIISYAYTAIRQSCLVPIQSVRELLCKSHQSRKDGSREDNMSFLHLFIEIWLWICHHYFIIACDIDINQGHLYTQDKNSISKAFIFFKLLSGEYSPLTKANEYIYPF